MHTPPPPPSPDGERRLTTTLTSMGISPTISPPPISALLSADPSRYPSRPSPGQSSDNNLKGKNIKSKNMKSNVSGRPCRKCGSGPSGGRPLVSGGGRGAVGPPSLHLRERARGDRLRQAATDGGLVGCGALGCRRCRMCPLPS
jgi:hypothetical protein